MKSVVMNFVLVQCLRHLMGVVWRSWLLDFALEIFQSIGETGYGDASSLPKSGFVSVSHVVASQRYVCSTRDFVIANHVAG